MRPFIAAVCVVAVTFAAPFAKAGEKPTRNPFTNSHPLGILQELPLQKSLALKDEQIEQIKAVAANGLKEDNIEKALAVLTKQQTKKYKQVYAQRQKAYLVFEDSVFQKLDLTAKQVAELKEAAEVNAKEHRKMVDFMSRARFRSREAMEEYRQGYAKPAQERLMAILTKPQNQQLKKMFATKKKEGEKD